ncbi:hypothetical protein [Achromobacter sp. UMC71]|uniref:hypothetical protein n=1 Tax=Achromobacter sp. UMC71 TaxID=1862320 RepID=UPI00160065A7|nr:hypothetical protein [Achromobacter sp. UMC71]MBB1627268.1 hypothetical protein [Achromobacter sp. UMC71]
MVSTVQGASGQLQTNLLAGYNNAVQFAQTIAQGLRRIIANGNNQPAPTFGQRYPVGNGQVQDRIGGYRVMGDKTRGVEPGFIGKRDWTPGDTGKMNTANHPFNTRALALAQQWLAAGALPPHTPADADLNPMLLNSLSGLAAGNGPLAPAAIQVLTDPALAQNGGSLIDVLRNVMAPNPPLNTALAAALVADTVAAVTTPGTHALANEATQLFRELTGDLMQTQAKFTKNHYIKLDYYEADRIAGKYHIPKDKAKGNLVTAPLHRLLTGATPAERNEGAVRESLANDLMRVMGVESQKLKIVEGRYPDGTTKLMLDGTHVANFSDFDGTPSRGDIYLKDGVLVRNQQRPTDPPNQFTGAPRLDHTINELGRNKILMLLLADRDALGSRGGNKGYVGNTFVGIDPGHALEESRLGVTNDVYSDFSFDQPGGPAFMGYKNFSMFDQSSLAEKMEGVRMIAHLSQSQADEDLFDRYAQEFGNNRPPEARFDGNINTLKALYIARRDALLGVFAQRLAVDNFAFGPAHPTPQYFAMRDATLNALDGLEKLTSKTTRTTKSGIQLDYPQVTAKSERKEWNVTQDPGTGDLLFVSTGKSASLAKMQTAIQGFPLNTVQGHTLQITPPGTLTLRIPVAQISALATDLAPAQIIAHKHP